MTSFTTVSDKMREKGVTRIIFKPLANNDNTKQQVYLGSDFDVIKAIPSGEIYADGVSKKGPIFKATLDFFWIDEEGNTEKAPNTQIILYPKYPEIRMSGFLSGTNKKLSITPRHLMQAPSKIERSKRINIHRYLILGVSKEQVFAYCTSWDDSIAQELKNKIAKEEVQSIASVFYEFVSINNLTSEEKLLTKLKEIYDMGGVESCRLNSHGEYIQYKAQNGAGYTLEAQFGIIPNGSPNPDFMDWELKAHSGNVVTLMTPEPNEGIYVEEGLKQFLDSYATRKQTKRLNFSSIHKVDVFNSKTLLTMKMEGYDPKIGKIIDPEGGLMLRDQEGNIAAGWRFAKIIDHWKKKHSNTCYVSYSANREAKQVPKYHFGPNILLGKGTSLTHFLEGLCSSTIYYDPGINMKLEVNKSGLDHWKAKKRNQFRAKWRQVHKLYNKVESIDLNNI